ncbi:MAG: NYN domain-containing protein, partial [Burkholderiaceae bacterium]
FELIEIPHVRQSGKNSADIRMVVDALDLCYTKGHVDTFVIISGDSDFSPLVSKLRENAKTVIGVGVKGSTSDLLTANCDEFIFYDDLVREQRRRGAQTAARRDGGRDGGREGGRDAGRDIGRDPAREGGREGGRDGGRDPARGQPASGRGNGRGPEREPLRGVPASLPTRPAEPIGVAARAHEESDETETVGGPWRPYAVDPRGDADPTGAGAGAVDTPQPPIGAQADDGSDTPAVADLTVAGERAALDAIAPAGPAPSSGRRPRRSRARPAEATIGLDAATTTAADLFAADLAERAASAPDPAGRPDEAHPGPASVPTTGTADHDDATEDLSPTEDAAAVALPKKRPPRRRKTAVDTPPADEPPALPDPAAEADATPELSVISAPQRESAAEPRPDDTADDDGFETGPGSSTASAPRRPRTDDERRQEAIDLALETVEALLAERGADDKIWGSMVKQTLKRRRPGFAESYYGYRSFNDLLEDARDRGLLALEHDEKSGGYVIRLL